MPNQTAGVATRIVPTATVAVLELRGTERPIEGAGNVLSSVCGLPVLVRTLLVLERAGFKRGFLLLHPDDRPAVSAALARHPRLRLPWSVLEDAGTSLGVLSEALQDGAAEETVLYWPASWSFGRFMPELPAHERAGAPEKSEQGATREQGAEEQPLSELVVFQSAAPFSTAPLFVAPASIVVAAAEREPGELVVQAEAHGRLSRATLFPPPVVVRDAASVRQAEEALLRSLRKDADGVVARFDRNISLAMSRRLMRFSVTPNQVTVFAALVGMMCGFIVSWGGYLPMLLGALAFQFNSILDGVDGEIARAKLLESASGQWFDTLADDASNLCFMIGASVGAYRTWGSSLYLVLGAVTAVGFVMASTIMYHYLLTRAHSGDLNDFAMPWEEGPNGRKVLTHHQPNGPFARLIAKIKWISRRDAYVFFSVVFGLLGQLRVMVWFFAVGTTLAWMTIAAYRVVLPLVRRPVAPI